MGGRLGAFLDRIAHAARCTSSALPEPSKTVFDTRDIHDDHGGMVKSRTKEDSPLNCQIAFTVTEEVYAKLEAVHLKLLGAGAGAPLSITGRIVFLRGLHKMIAEQKRGKAVAPASQLKKKGGDLL